MILAQAVQTLTFIVYILHWVLCFSEYISMFSAAKHCLAGPEATPGAGTGEICTKPGCGAALEALSDCDFCLHEIEKHPCTSC